MVTELMQSFFDSVFNQFKVKLVAGALALMGTLGLGEYAWIQTTPEYAMAQMLLALKHQNMTEFNQVVDTQRVIDTSLQGFQENHPLLGSLVTLGKGGLRTMAEGKIEQTVTSGTPGTETLPDAAWLVATALKWLPDTPFYTFKLEPVASTTAEVLHGTFDVKGQHLTLTFEKSGVLGAWRIVSLEVPKVAKPTP